MGFMQFTRFPGTSGLRCFGDSGWRVFTGVEGLGLYGFVLGVHGFGV